MKPAKELAIAAASGDAKKVNAILKKTPALAKVKTKVAGFLGKTGAK